MPTNDYTTTQRADDFRVGETVVVRNCVYANGSVLNVGETYTVKEVRVENADRGSGDLLLEERQDGQFGDGRFGHLLFDHWEAALMPGATEAEDRPFKVGDRVVVTDARTQVGSDYVGAVGTVRDDDGGDARFPFRVDFDDPDLTSGGNWSKNALDPAPIEDAAPDLSDAEVRKSLPVEQAYPVGSIWNHRSSGSQPVTITGYKTETTRWGEAREYVLVDVPQYAGQQPYSGDWIRGALDSYGTLVSLPDSDEAPVEDAEAVAQARAAELESLKASRNEIAEDRAVVKRDLIDLRERLASSEDRANEGWAIAAKQQAVIEFIRLNFLSDSDLDKVDGFELGWDARNND